MRPSDLARIVRRSARLLEVEIDDGGARAIADRSRGTPRVANRLLKRVRDFAQVRGDGVITAAVAAAALDLLEVDHEGLDRLDREILRAICEKFGGGPVGLSTLAIAVGEEEDTIQDVYEPYLLQRGLIERTPRGRDRDNAGVRPPRIGAPRAIAACLRVSEETEDPGYPRLTMSSRALLHLPALRPSLDGD